MLTWKFKPNTDNTTSSLIKEQISEVKVNIPIIKKIKMLEPRITKLERFLCFLKQEKGNQEQKAFRASNNLHWSSTRNLGGLVLLGGEAAKAMA
jgi:hypothetical protein